MALHLIFWCEIAVGLALIIIILLAVIYYGMSFIEERLPTITRFGSYLATSSLVLSLLIIPAGYGKLAFFTTFLTNALWLSVLSRGFPFIEVYSLDLIAALGGSVLTHFSWLYEFIYVPVGAFMAISLYAFFVWLVPGLVLMSLTLTDENSQNRREHPRSIWTTLLSRIITGVRSVLPAITRKRSD
jgi:hypothetical protein